MKRAFFLICNFLSFLFFLNTALFAAEMYVFSEEALYASQEFDEPQRTSIRAVFSSIREKTPEKLEDPIFAHAMQQFVTNKLSPEQIGAIVICLDMSGEKLKAAGFIACLDSLYEEKIYILDVKQIGALFMGLVAIEDISILGHPAFSAKLEKLITARATPADISKRITNLATLTRREILESS